MQPVDKPQDKASSPALAPSGALAAAPLPRRKPPVGLIVGVGLALLAGGIYGGQWMLHRQAYVSTDDAMVSGNLINVSSRVPGHVAKLLVDEGQQVKAGQVIALLDDGDFQAQLAQAEAALAVARTGLRTSETGVSLQTTQTSTQIAQADSVVHVAKASLSTAKANAAKARADLKRVERLFGAGGTSLQALEGARTTMTAAESSVTAATSQLRSAEEGLRLANAGSQQVVIKKGGVATVEAQIHQAQASVNIAKRQLGHATITSPVDGTVARRMANVGEQVSTGQGIYAISETGNLWVSAHVEETHIARVKPDAAVEVRIDAYPGKVFHGKVSEIGSVTGSQFSLLPQNNAAGNFTKVVQRLPVRIRFAETPAELKPGMSAVIDIMAPRN